MKRPIQFKLLHLLLLPVLLFTSCKKDDLLSKNVQGLKDDAASIRPFYSPGDHWWQQPDLIVGGYPLYVYGSASFVINNKAYIATPSELWEYNPASGTWTDKGPVPESHQVRTFAVAFAIGGKGYYGTGYTYGCLKDFWEYDPATNLWTQKADFKGGKRAYAVGFAIGNKGYIGTGQDDAGNYKNDFWEYDPATNLWTQKASMPSTRAFAVGLSVYGTGYIGTGRGKYYNPRGDYIMIYYDDLWEYNQAMNQWKQKAGLPAARMGATGFALTGKLYLGTGYNSGLVPMKDFYEFNPAANSWTRIPDYGGGETGYATGFAISTNGFVLRSPKNFGDPNADHGKNFWKYILTGEFPTHLNQLDTARF